jgi:hypothetical protein
MPMSYKSLDDIKDNSGNWGKVVDFLINYTRHPADEVERVINEFLAEIGNMPCITVARHLPMADCEAHLLERLAQSVGVPTICLSYPDDRYHKDNPEKRKLLERLIFSGTGRAGGPKLRKEALKTRPAMPHGHRLSDIRVENPEETLKTLLEFHLDERVLHGLTDRHVDIGRVLAALAPAVGGDGRSYNYPIYFALTALGIYVLEDFEVAYAKGMHLAMERALRLTSEAGLEPNFIHVPDEQALGWYPASPEIDLPPAVLALEQQLLAA